MLKLTYIPVDKDHESAVVEIDTNEMVSGVTGIQYHDPVTGMDRCINYNKLVRVEFDFVVTQEFVNRAVNTMRMKEMNRYSHGNQTIR